MQIETKKNATNKVNNIKINIIKRSALTGIGECGVSQYGWEV